MCLMISSWPSFGFTDDDFNSQLRSVLDVHTPATCREVTQCKSTPWYCSVVPELNAVRKERWWAEWQWLALGLTVHKQIMNLFNFRHQVTKLVAEAKTEFCSCKVAAAKACKELFQLIGSWGW